MYCCYICHRAINQKSDCQCLLTEVYLRCRFSLLFSFTVSITLLYVSHWPQSRVCHYKVFQLSIQYAHWGSILEFPQPSQQHKIRLPNNAPMELPNGLSPSSFLLVKSKAWDKVQGSWFEVFLL